MRKWLRELSRYRKEHLGFDRLLALGSFGLTVLGVCLTIWTPENYGLPWIAIRNFVVFAALCILIYLTVTLYGRRELLLQRLAKRLSRYDKSDRVRESNLQDMTRIFTDALVEYQSEFSNSHTKNSAADETAMFRDIANRLTMSARSGLQEIFISNKLNIGEDLAISVKLIQTEEQVQQFLIKNQVSEEQREEILSNPVRLTTIYRDNYTYSKKREREIGSDSNSVNGNTVFKALLRNKEEYFINNDLEGLGNVFENQNKDWRKYYNATLAVPIGRPTKVDEKGGFFGVLSADSLNPNKWELFDETCLPLMFHVADLFLIYFLEYAASSTELDGNSQGTADDAK